MIKKWRVTFKEIIKDSFPTRTSGKLDSMIVEGSDIQGAIKNYYEGKIYWDTLIRNIVKVESLDND
tara:strand:- start:401 stop:598 length:198 start_codon:yes stop_codon:yes gene_type:complete